MDVTHIPEFRKLAYVHVTIDAYTHVIMDTTKTREAVKDVIQHLIICFSSLVVSKRIKQIMLHLILLKDLQSFTFNGV